MAKKIVPKLSRCSFIVLLCIVTTIFTVSFVGEVYAASCGGPGQRVVTAIDLGCAGRGNPIMDMMFAIIRLLSMGVGLIVIGSIIVAGIQYSASRDDPQAVAKAKGRIMTSLGALLIYIFAYAILNYVVPGQFLE